MTSAPLPVEQFGTWLGELVATLQDADGETAAPSSPQSSSGEPNSSGLRAFPFQPAVGNFVHSIAKSLHSPQANNHVHTSHAGRAAALLRHQIIQNLGSPSARI